MLVPKEHRMKFMMEAASLMAELNPGTVWPHGGGSFINNKKKLIRWTNAFRNGTVYQYYDDRIVCRWRLKLNRPFNLKRITAIENTQDVEAVVTTADVVARVETTIAPGTIVLTTYNPDTGKEKVIMVSK